MLTLEAMAALTDADPNHQLALAQGYTSAGVMRGHAFYHPPGGRTSCGPCPDYCGDWNATMGLVWTYLLWWVVPDGWPHWYKHGTIVPTEAQARRQIAEYALTVAQGMAHGPPDARIRQGAR